MNTIEIGQSEMNLLKDHLIPPIVDKKMIREMHTALVTLYQSENMSKRMLLKNKLTSTRMSMTNTLASYLMKLIEFGDQLVAAGDMVEDNELVWINLNGFGPS